jgi:hypothetical protein
MDNFEDISVGNSYLYYKIISYAVNTFFINFINEKQTKISCGQKCSEYERI